VLTGVARCAVSGSVEYAQGVTSVQAARPTVATVATIAMRDMLSLISVALTARSPVGAVPASIRKYDSDSS
jgi:hypothetical protein